MSFDSNVTINQFRIRQLYHSTSLVKYLCVHYIRQGDRGEKWEIPDHTPWLQTSSRLNGNRETVKMAVKQKETGATL